MPGKGSQFRPTWEGAHAEDLLGLYQPRAARTITGGERFPHIFPFDPWQQAHFWLELQTSQMSELAPTQFETLEDRLEELSSRLTTLESTIRQIEVTVNEIRQEQLDRCVIKQAVLRDLNSQSYQLKAPIEVLIEEHDEEVVASWPEIEAFASGDSASEALSRLKQEIVSLYQDLKTADLGTLGQLPSAWLRILSRLLEPIDAKASA